MKRPALIPLILWVAITVACSESNVARPRRLESGTVLVFVYWNQQGLPGKRVELVELGIELKTNDEGFAEFVVPIGDYTVRVHEINRGGPPLLYIDTEISVTAKEETRVDVADCLECV